MTILQRREEMPTRHVLRADARGRVNAVGVRTPFTTKLIQELIDRMTGLLDHAQLETRVAWVRDLFKRIDVDGVQRRAVARWKAPTDQDVDRLVSVTEWLRRTGAGRVLNRLGSPKHEIPLPRPPGSREWLRVALVECAMCRQVVERTSPFQRHCVECRHTIKRARSREAVGRARARLPLG